MHSQPKILAVGTGAVGSLYAGKLAQAGAVVSVLCRSDYDVVKQCGIAIKSRWGDFHFQPATVIRAAAEYQDAADYVLVALKVLPEVDVRAIIAPAVRPGTRIVLLQNGIDIEPPVQRAFPDNEIISGLAFVYVSRNGFGDIDHQDYGRVVLGTYPSGGSPAVQRLVDLFTAVNVPCESTEDIVKTRWEKLVWNVAFNPLSVLGGGADTARIMGNPVTERLVREIMLEVCRVARVDGVHISLDRIDKYMKDTKAMKPYRTSMLLDWMAGRPMEVEAILGNAVRRAQVHKIDIPTLDCLYGLMTLMESR